MAENKEQKDLVAKREISREERAALKEVFDKAGKARFGDRFKGVAVLTEEEAITTARENIAIHGAGIDMEI